MAKKILRVTLDITVEDLDDKEREQFARDATMEVEELSTLEDYEPDSLANLLDCLEGEGTNNLIFEGTDYFAKFTAVDVVSAQFKD